MTHEERAAKAIGHVNRAENALTKAGDLFPLGEAPAAVVEALNNATWRLEKLQSALAQVFIEARRREGVS
jgi:hypothetical protein